MKNVHNRNIILEKRNGDLGDLIGYLKQEKEALTEARDGNNDTTIWYTRKLLGSQLFAGFAVFVLFLLLCFVFLAIHFEAVNWNDYSTAAWFLNPHNWNWTDMKCFVTPWCTLNTPFNSSLDGRG